MHRITLRLIATAALVAGWVPLAGAPASAATGASSATGQEWTVNKHYNDLCLDGSVSQGVRLTSCSLETAPAKSGSGPGNQSR